VLYSAWVFTVKDVYRTWAAQNLILSPHPLHYLAAYGAPLALAALAVRDAWRDDGVAWLPLVWIGVVPLLVYLPFNLQRRLVVGAQVPLSLLAAWGTVHWWRRGRRWLPGGLVATMLPSGFILLVGAAFLMFARPSPAFRDVAEIAAMDWLADVAQPDDVILTAYDTGNYLPTRALTRVFLGHGFETVDADAKEGMVTRFFAATTDDTWRRNLLAEYGVDYVFWGPAERRLGSFDPTRARYLEPVYQAPDYVVFLFEVDR
jgi:hypothetical protein